MTLYAYKGSIIILQAQLITYKLMIFSFHHETEQKARIHTAGTSVRTDILLIISAFLLTIWIFQVLPESLKIHRGRPRSNLSDAENSPKWSRFVKIIEIFFPGRSTIGAVVGRPDTLWSVVQAPYGRSTTDLMVGRPSDS